VPAPRRGRHVFASLCLDEPPALGPQRNVSALASSRRASTSARTRERMVMGVMAATAVNTLSVAHVRNGARTLRASRVSRDLNVPLSAPSPLIHQPSSFDLSAGPCLLLGGGFRTAATKKTRTEGETCAEEAPSIEGASSTAGDGARGAARAAPPRTTPQPGERRSVSPSVAVSPRWRDRPCRRAPARAHDHRRQDPPASSCPDASRRSLR
jgi:hypothetical protein